jgi:predicted ArsR family transcriptional regulator
LPPPPALPSFAATLTVGSASNWLHCIADPVRLALTRHLSEVQHATRSELAASCQTSLPTVRRHLEAMVLVGLVEESEGESDGRTYGRPATRFSLPLSVRHSVRAVLGGQPI